MADVNSKPLWPSASVPANEAARLAALRQYNILDTPPEVAFDRITTLAARLFDVPIALISLVDESRVWFKSCYGMAEGSVPRDKAFCSLALQSSDGLVILDAQQDQRFSHNALVQGDAGLRFYAGMPLVSNDGFVLGTLCVLDTQPRQAFDAEQRSLLADLAAMVMDALELRLNARKVIEIETALVEVTQDVATQTGEAFLQTLVRRFTQTLGVDIAHIGLSDNESERVTTLAVCAHGAIVENLDYPLRNGPCERVLQERQFCCYPSGVKATFPHFPLLQEWAVESYAAVPIFDRRGQSIGVLGIMHSQALTNIQLAETLLPIFALRTATELERQRTDAARQQMQQDLEQLVAQRTAELSEANLCLQQESAERQQTAIALQKDQETLQVLLDSVQAGIVACNAEGILTLFNKAARDFHGLPEQPLPADQWADCYDLYLGDGKTPMPKQAIPLFRALQGEIIHNAEMVIAPQQGKVRTLLASGRAIADLDDKRLGAVVVMHDITERKEMENALRDSEAQLSGIFQTIPDGILILDSTGQLVTANAAAEKILRLSVSGLTQRTYNDVAWQITDTDGQPIAEADLPFAQVMRTGEAVYNVENAITHADGSRTLLCINASPMVDGEGQITHVVASISDITESKQAEAVRQESEERYRSVIETAAEGIVLQQADGEIFTCNASAEEILGLTADQMMGRTSLDSRWASIREDGSPFPGDEHPAMVTLHTGEPQTNVVMGVCKPNGTLTWISINTRPLFQPQSAKPSAVVASFFDITDRKLAEVERAQLIREQAARLEAEAEHFRSALLVDISTTLASLLHHADTLQQVADRVVPAFADWCLIDVLQANRTIERVAIAHSDPDQVTQSWKIYRQYPMAIDQAKGVTAILNRGQTRLVPQISEATLEAIASSPDHLQYLRRLGLRSCIVAPLIARGQTLGVVSFITAESDRVYTRADRALAENIAHQVAIATDNTRLYQAEQTARSEAEAANRTKDEFLAVLSHELRSPLNPILGWAQLLQTRQYDPQTLAKGLETIERNAKLQTQLIEDLLDVSRILRGKLTLNVEAVNLQSTLEAALETVRLAAEAKAITVDTWVEPNFGPVLGDAGRLQQVVWNLLSNAVKFTPQGGQVAVRLEAVGEGRAAQAQITVTDTGKGITPEFLPHIFERFRQADSKTTRQFGGLGLGLAIVRQLVELHGGTIGADSPGEELGATFTVRLPLLRQALSMTQRPAHPPAMTALPTRLANLRILVVDDEVDARNLLVFVLEQAGAIVTSAVSASEALTLLATLDIDLLISDIGMPNMDGYMLMRQIVTQYAAQDGALPFKTMALTAYAGDVNGQNARTAGFACHLSKPFEAEDLLRAIAALMQPS